MRLGVNLPATGAVELAVEAERLGYEVALASEGYRADAPSVLGLVAGRTERIALASGVMQIPARPPGAAALTAATLDAISGGRFRLGLGVSNPHVSDGWYGVPFAHSLGRTREYVDIVRQALRGGPVRYRGKHFALPAQGYDEAPLCLLVEPLNATVPVYLGAVGPRSLALAGEIADGWVSGFTTPELVAASVARLGEGRARAGLTMAGFDVIPFVAVSVAGSVAAAADDLRAHYTHLLGIGGAQNFYCRLAADLGYGPEIGTFQERLAAGDRRGAAAAVPVDFIDRTALLGPVDRVADRMRAFADAGVTVLSVLVTANQTDLAGRIAVLRHAAAAARRLG